MTGGIIIIGDGGTLRATMEASTQYPVSAGDAVENNSGASANLSFVQGSLVEPFTLPNGGKHTFTEAGAVELSS